jgi:hypothetical protein
MRKSARSSKTQGDCLSTQPGNSSKTIRQAGNPWTENKIKLTSKRTKSPNSKIPKRKKRNRSKEIKIDMQ